MGVARGGRRPPVVTTAARPWCARGRIGGVKTGEGRGCVLDLDLVFTGERRPYPPHARTVAAQGGRAGPAATSGDMASVGIMTSQRNRRWEKSWWGGLLGSMA